MLVTASVFIVLIVVLITTSAFWVNWWWFGSMGYRSVLTTRYMALGLSFAIGGLIASAILVGNVVVALRRTRSDRPLGAVARFSNRVLVTLLFAGVTVMFVGGGVWSGRRWDTWLLWLNSEDFGVDDPVFGRDAGFYIFSVPALQAIRSGLLVVLLLTLAAVTLVYALRLGVNMRRIRTAPETMRVHLFALGGAILLILAGSYWLANFDLAYSTRGFAFGPSYTDVNVQRIANWLLAAVSVAAAAILLANAFVRRAKLLVGIVLLWGALSLVVGVVIPEIVQRVVVEPSELARERPYIANNIEMTSAAYGLDQVEERELPGTQPIQADELSTHQATLDNIRLWDYRIIRTTFQQLQSFVPYYVFQDVDVERYTVDGATTQVLLAAREIEPSNLPENAQRWTNLRLVYTHGYAVVVSPADEVNRQGLPTFLVNNIPPNGSGPFAIDRPEIYFGETQGDWVVTNSGQEEFSGLEEAEGTTQYAGEGKGTIQLDDYLTKVMVATHLGDRNLLLSGAITDDARIHLHRTITDRIDRIAPFLELDDDPYMVIDQGRLFWIVDAYTASNRFPAATRTRGINYLRNSVKVVVDAYDGTVWFYRTAVPDPIADAYGDIYDDLFVPIADAPPGIAAHFRYPELLFDIQSEIYSTFHVADPTAFYNGEDRWSIPVEEVSGSTDRMEPYYVTMTLPSEQELAFTLIRPFIPGGRTDRQNMTAWMAGQTDERAASRLVVYRFPRQETVFGPRQIEARINQDPEISAQISLWNQAGSEVIRGNMLVVPIEESVLYVQPLYLEARGTDAALPELKRVIVASSERVVMRESLEEALEALTQSDAATVDQIEQPDGVTTETQLETPAQTSLEPTDNLAREALNTYERAQVALSVGDWEAYGREQAALESILRELAAATDPETDGTPTPVATPLP
ncbi:MAG: UPF0182 family protein [Thermomicrobiales bacterium]